MRTLAPLLSLALIACGTSRDPAFYAVSPVAGAPVVRGSVTPIELRRPSLAGYLDRSELVVGVLDHRVRVRSGESWAEPLDDMIERVLAQDLRQRLPGAVLLRDGETLGGRPRAIVSVDVERFDEDAAGRVVLVAEVVLLAGPGQDLVSKAIASSVAPGGPGTAALVDAMSVLLGRLADAIASLLSTPGTVSVGPEAPRTPRPG